MQWVPCCETWSDLFQSWKIETRFEKHVLAKYGVASGSEPDFEIVAECWMGHQGSEAIEKLRFGLTFLDIRSGH